MVGLKREIYEQLLTEMGKIILYDELAHGAALEARHPLYQLVKTEVDARIALEIVRKYSTIRLKGRNFQFGHPLSEERIEAIARGEIEPAKVEILKSAYAGAIDEAICFQRFHKVAKPLSGSTVIR